MPIRDEKFVEWVPGRKDYRAAARDLPSFRATASEILEAHDGFKLAGDSGSSGTSLE